MIMRVAQLPADAVRAIGGPGGAAVTGTKLIAKRLAASR
jgi:hypothetical protein